MKALNHILGILFVVMLYLYLHNPTLPFGVGACKLLYPFALVFIFFRVKSFSRYLYLFRTELIFLLLLTVYSTFEFLFIGEPNTMRLHLVGIVEYFVLPFFIILSIRQTDGSLVKYLLITASVGAVITLFCVIFPSFNEYLRLTVNRYMYSSMDEYRASTTYRGFGISEALTYSYGIIQGIFFVMTLYFFKSNKWVLPFSFLIILSAALNARTGIIVAACGVLIFLLKRGRGLAVFILLGVAIIAANIIPILQLMGVEPRTLDWLYVFAEETSSIFSNRDITASVTTSYMFKDMLVFPQSFHDWILGCGRDIYWRPYRRSDMGWIIQLNFGGLPYLFLELGFLAYLFRRLSKAGYTNLAFFFAVAFTIANTKGPALPNSGIFRLLMLIYIYYILSTVGSGTSAGIPAQPETAQS